MKVNKINKKSYIVCAMVFVLLMTNILTCFAKVGDVIGWSKRTDINAYINHYILVSHNIDGNTVVEAEDLANFGFNVVWDGNARTLTIDRNPEITDITQKFIPWETKPSLVGRYSMQVLETDIKTYINGVETQSYNVGGKTMIIFDSLTPYGQVVWDGDARTLKLWIEDGLEMRESMQMPAALPRTTLYSADGRTIEVYEDETDSYLAVGWYKTKEEADSIAKAEKNNAKNMAVIGNFYIGQNVSQWSIGFTAYGTVRDIDYNTGKVQVYWTSAKDNNGKDVDYVTGTLYAALNRTTWASAYTLNPLN